MTELRAEISASESNRKELEKLVLLITLLDGHASENGYFYVATAMLGRDVLTPYPKSLSMSGNPPPVFQETQGEHHSRASAQTSEPKDSSTHQHAYLSQCMTPEEQQIAQAAAQFGYGPLAQVTQRKGAFYPAFGGEMQPGLMPAANIKQRKFGNPAPLGLCAFALTTFVLSLINLQTRGVTAPNIVVASAYAYGGFIQVLSGMW
ncbi:hypothetical protein KEM54_005807 [Ascosphaera aggregata]|nr:hypothetical protein KEM54_005807 [Ascosphaera aggregata]